MVFAKFSAHKLQSMLTKIIVAVVGMIPER